MSYQLVDFQDDVVAACYRAYANGARNVMPVLPTGAGKTVIMGHMAHEYDGYGVSIAHRGELVGQMSLALAREGLRHDIIAPNSLIRTIVGAHMEEIGRSYYDARAKWKVASVDTIIRRDLPKTWTKQVGVAHTDEGHHVLRDNKWGRALSVFDNAYGLLPTATPDRADGRGLGRHADGVVDAMVEGPGMRWLINNGYLTDYHVLAPMPDDLDMAGVEISKTTGDYNADKMRKRVKASNKIVGDVVKTYLEFARGMKGITFAVDVEHATQISNAFNAAGVCSQIVHAETPEADRREYMRRFRKGDLAMLVNVDLFGEGVDVPAVQVVIMARPTASYGLYAQQFGRALRLLVSPILRAAWHNYSVAQRLQFIAESEKPRAMVIDHVGNIIKHNGPPDWRTIPWSLDAREKRRRTDDAIPLRACANPECNEPFLRIYPSCPHCGWTPPEPADRSRPEFVDGDIVMYTPELLQQLFGAKKALDNDFVAIPQGVTPNSAIAQRLRNIHAANKASQKLLRDAMGLVLPPSMDERVANRRFFHTFGVDTLSAQGLTSSDAENLRQRIIQKVTSQ
jgi:DNA or RNA helicases of superfamily II